MWHHIPQQQQRGAQLDRSGKDAPPADAVAGREAQDHEQAGGDPRSGPGPGRYPASRIEDREQDNTPDDPDPRVEWDEVVQPERVDEKQGD